MRYDIDCIPCGVFCSKLERQWFCFLSQSYKQVSYVGHVCNWRDFIVDGVSVEVKPKIENLQDSDLIREVWLRLPIDQKRLVLLIGNPTNCNVIAISRTEDGYSVKEGIARNGIS